ncbi:PPR_1 domain-containing protein/PPR_2 domain-containing protein [Cephalotus follicularis]|uniref:PPR_1 domain-containing protein/PPR_2 domain-containing protein n=1 Tax=Cephalotus follicularis TaxID=3775 RepID=A0A1Q3BEH6_CEPFO|nr:PPR_1 domain-containing protein/PPR_2 domain-containing protein [Cephalotus follicularis]
MVIRIQKPPAHINHFLHHPFTTISTPPPQDPTTLATQILNSTSKTLPQILESQSPSIQWTPQLVNKTLKTLWNHGPKALQFFTNLLRHPHFTPHASSFDHAIDIASRLRDYKTTWSLVSRMRSLRLGPTPKTFAIITERYAASGKPDRAIRVFLNMHEQGCRQDLNSFNSLLDVLCKEKRVEKAYGLFKMLRGRFKPDVVSYNIIASGWCLIKRTNKALEVLKEMVERGISPNLRTYNIMLNGYVRAGQIKEAWEFFMEMKKRKCEIDVVTYTTIVHGFGVMGEIKRARKVFDEMIKEGVLPSVATYNAMIQVLCKKDSVENAILVFEEMVRKGYVPNSITYNLVIRGLCHEGEMERAMDFVERMKSDNCEPNVQTYNVVIRYFCDSGEIEKGLDVFEKMDREGCLPNLDTYNVLINAMFVRKKSDDLLVAGRMLIEMVDRGFMPRKFTFNRVLNGLLLTGNQEFAKEILRLQSRCGRLPRKLKL